MIEIFFSSANISALILEGFAVSQTLPIDSLKLFYNGLTERIKKTSSGNNIESILFPPVMPTDVGQIAPMFSGPNPKGEILQLKDLMGKITLIDFWAAWCRPCRIENPNLVKLYKEMVKNINSSRHFDYLLCMLFLVVVVYGSSIKVWVWVVSY